MKILVIDEGNYVDYPTGGHLAFVRNMLNAFPEEELALVGSTTDSTIPVGKWFKRIISGKKYDYFAVRYLPNSSNKPLIPARINAYLAFRFYRNRFLKYNFDCIFLQSPEVLLAIPVDKLDKACIRLPGVENPLHMTRYKWAKIFAPIYDMWFYNKAKHARCILAAASTKAIQNFVSIGKNKIPIEHIHQFPTRFNKDYFYFMNQDLCRKKLRIPSNKVVYVTVGRLSEFKGWKLMIDAFSILHHKNHETLFYFIGDGEDEIKIKKYIDFYNIKDCCFLVGRKNPQEIGIYLNASSVFVMASMIEGWSTTLLEACACGVPCVTTNFNSAEDMIKNGVNGFILTNRDPSAFASLLNQAIDLPRNRIIQYNTKYNMFSVQYLRENLLSFLR